MHYTPVPWQEVSSEDIISVVFVVYLIGFAINSVKQFTVVFLSYNKTQVLTLQTKPCSLCCLYGQCKQSAATTTEWFLGVVLNSFRCIKKMLLSLCLFLPPSPSSSPSVPSSSASSAPSYSTLRRPPSLTVSHDSLHPQYLQSQEGHHLSNM